MAAGLVSSSHSKAALILGVLELLFAACIATCSFVLDGRFDASVSLTPYWAVLPHVFPGILGIVVGVTKNHCAMVAFMVVNIICSVIDCIACFLLFICVAEWTRLASAVDRHDDCTYDSYTKTCSCSSSRDVRGIKNCDAIKTATALILTIVAFATINCIVSLAASIVGCASECCSGNQQQPGAVIVQQPFYIQQQGYAVPMGHPQHEPPPPYNMNDVNQ